MFENFVSNWFKITTKQDVWALGICMAELFTRRRVSFEHGTTDVLAQVLPLCDQKIPPWMIAKSPNHFEKFFFPRLLPDNEENVVDTEKGVHMYPCYESDNGQYYVVEPHEKYTCSDRILGINKQNRIVYEQFKDSLMHLLTVDVNKRPTAVEALQHPFLSCLDTTPPTFSTASSPAPDTDLGTLTLDSDLSNF